MFRYSMGDTGGRHTEPGDVKRREKGKAAIRLWRTRSCVDN